MVGYNDDSTRINANRVESSGLQTTRVRIRKEMVGNIDDSTRIVSNMKSNRLAFRRLVFEKKKAAVPCKVSWISVPCNISRKI